MGDGGRTFSLTMFTYIVGVKWYLGMVSIYTSFVSNVDEHPNFCLPAICFPSFLKFLPVFFSP